MKRKVQFNHNLIQSIDYLESVISLRLTNYFGKKQKQNLKFPEFKLTESYDFFTKAVATKKMTIDEFVIFLLAIVPHIKPDFFTNIFRNQLPEGGDFEMLGGIKGKNHRGILPTGETAMFILAGKSLSRRFEVQQIFSSDHWFLEERVLSLEQVPEGDPVLSGKLILDSEWVEEITTGKVSPPTFNTRFPAERLIVKMEWDDLVLPMQTMSQIYEIKTWLIHYKTLLEDWGMGKKLKPGYRVLFHGPPGTGKTLTAALLGQSVEKSVYKIDLSMVVSKFIGETEKNLANLFAKAENKDWILFFDEADALFGKRTNVRDAHDKYANQEVSYLLQRVEGFNGLVILASNFKSNIDDAFVRRFQSIIYFPVPGPEERLLLWKKGFPANIELEDKLDLKGIAQKFELTGAMIMNVIQFVCLKALNRNETTILEEDILIGIKKEFLKEGKMMR